MNIVLKEALKLLGVSLIMALLINYLSPSGIALQSLFDTSHLEGSLNAIGGEGEAVPLIDELDAAKTIFDEGKAIFIDARAQDIYDEGHIEGAESLPLEQFESRIAEFISRHPLSTPLITYCSGRTCRDSHELARLLLTVGYQDVRIFIDGYPAWQQKGYPSE